MKYDPKSNRRIAEFELMVVKAWEASGCTPSEYALALSKLLNRYLWKYVKPKKK